MARRGLRDHRANRTERAGRAVAGIFAGRTAWPGHRAPLIALLLLPVSGCGDWGATVEPDEAGRSAGAPVPRVVVRSPGEAAVPIDGAVPRQRMQASPSSTDPAPVDPGPMSRASARADFAARSGIRTGVEDPLRLAEPPTLGPWVRVHGAKLRWVSGVVGGHSAEGHMLVVAPEAQPAEPGPVLLHFSGHWGGGVQSEEMLPGAILLAQAGVEVWLVPLVGDERSVEPGTAFRTQHQDRGAWADLQLRRSFGSAVAWDIRSARALMGARSLILGEREAGPLYVAGFSGGAERALGYALLHDDVRGLVLGAHEYAYGTQGGHAFCACGALAGAGPDAGRRAARWFESLEPMARLVVEGEGTAAVDGGGASPTVRRVPGRGHTLGVDEHREILRFVRGHSAAVGQGRSTAAALSLGWTPGRDAYVPWREPLSLPSWPGMVAATPGRGGSREPVRIEREAQHGTVGTGPTRWLLCFADEPSGPFPADGGPLPYGPPRALGGDPLGHLATHAASDHTFAWIRPGLAGGHGEDLQSTRLALERGLSPLGAVVEQLRLFALRPENAGAKGWIGIGACGVAIRALPPDSLGLSQRPLLVDAPANLLPAQSEVVADRVPSPRWPLWVLDAAAGLDARIETEATWIRPLDERGAAWTGPVEGGIVPGNDVAAAFSGVLAKSASVDPPSLPP